MSNNPNNYPDPQSPEGKSRAGRLYFSLLVILFIFLGTVIMIHQFGNNIVDKVPAQLVKLLPISQNAAPAEAEASPEGEAQTEQTAAEGEQPTAEEAPAEGEAAATEEAPADAEPVAAPEEGAH